MRGFTMLEMIITIAIFAILAAVAVPSFRDTMLGNQMAASGNEFSASLNFARAEALNRRTLVIACQTKQADTVAVGAAVPCGDGTGFESGWIVYIPDAGNAHVQEILRRSPVLPPKFTLRGNSKVAASVGFGSIGQAGVVGGTNTNGTLRLCDSRDSNKFSRVFVISTAGRVRSLNGDPASSNADSASIPSDAPSCANA